MVIESAILISAISLMPIEKNITLDHIKKTPYELLYSVENIPNKNTMEYNTITTKELITINNENSLIWPR